jgi:NAD(P)H-hydrate epimerase
MKIATAAEIREIDRLSTEKYGIPSLLLMENAGMRVVEVLERRFPKLKEKVIGILCGKGNNGGDGFVVARQLIQNGCFPFVYVFAKESDIQGDAKTNYDILKAIGHPPTIILDENEWSKQQGRICNADIIVDGLLGTGVTKPVEGLYKAVIETRFPRAAIVSIDVPSGLVADKAVPAGPSFKADLTVTFSALKPCLVLPPSCERTGDVVVANIGNPRILLESGALKLNLIDPVNFTAARRPRDKDTHKGTFGRVLIVGGSGGKSGAAAMAGHAALRAGAGLVTVATAVSARPLIAASMPELMTEALEETDEGTIANQSIPAIMDGKTVIGIGPGMTTHPETAAFVRSLVDASPVPVVIDADGLNAFVGRKNELRGGKRPVVITPHPGEMSRLIERSVEDRVRDARDFAMTGNVHIVLKGYRTVIGVPDGSVYINPTGNPGMATAGTGDVLTGLIVGILAQEDLGTFVERLCLAVYLHGLAGDLAAREIGEESMIATDILRFLPRAWESLRTGTLDHPISL